MTKPLWPIALFLAACRPAATPATVAPRPEWRVTALDRRTLLVQADFSAVEHAAYEPPGRLTDLGDWRWNRKFVDAARKAQSRRPEIEQALTNVANWKVDGLPISRLGYWKSSTGLSRFPDTTGKTNVAYAVDVIYNVFLFLPDDIGQGQTRTIETPFETTLPFIPDPDAPSPFIKVNQVGYLPNARRKYATVGGWLGTAGPWEPPFEATTFEVINARTGAVALKGTLDDCDAEGTTPAGIPWYGENPREANLSTLTAPGTYFLRVPGVGRSREFRVDASAARETFSIAMHGLFVQRCGSSDKREPYTHWGDAPCHRKIFRSTFPPDAADYVGASHRTDYGFMDANGKPVNTLHFHVITLNQPKNAEAISAPGGWHDAADYDRRTMHLDIVNMLAGAYLLHPENFRDGDLNLPERANGIPDILDEAAWGLEHLRATQQPDGGVGGWIETCGHPVEGMGMPSDDTNSPYYLSRATRASTLSYCAAAALLSRLDPRLRARFLDSAIRAWRFVHTAKPAANVPFSSKNGRETVQLYWTERKDLPAKDLLKAALNLSCATHDPAYLNQTLTPEFAASFTDDCRRNGPGWQPFHLIELHNETLECLKPYRDEVASAIKRIAAKREKYFQSNTAYRTDWPAPKTHPAPNSMPWGNCHPMRSALCFVAAHAFHGERRYLDEAQLCYDFHCGCNPDGMTLTSGLGTVYPTSMLHLQSSADGIAECAAGITPYRWTGRPYSRDSAGLVHTPEEEKIWPVWRWRPNLETLHVASGEFTVWETIAPVAAVAGCLMSPSNGAPPVTIRPPAAKLADLPGYWAIP